MSNPADNLGKVISDAENNSTGYYGSTNGDNGRFSKPECTWYCWGRSMEKKGINIEFTGTAGANEWYAHVNTTKSGTVTKRAASLGPIVDSIASFTKKSDTSKGHVIYIEAISGDYTYFTEYHFDVDNNGVLQRVLTTNFATMRSNFSLNGYIVVRATSEV
jgi:surface antigen